jgi:hypothetical protein
MVDAFIYDHVRTPRGRGKPDGALHTASTLHLASTALKAITASARPASIRSISPPPR